MAGVSGARVAPIPIVALDVPSWSDAASLVQRLGDGCDFYKVGSELFTAAGPSCVTALREGGKSVFLDLKFHDIPATVRGAVRSAADLGASLVTVHASGGRAMLERAVDAAGARCRVLAVTVLTSLDGPALGDAWGRPVAAVEEEVLRLAALARAAGAHGLVCSGREAGAVRAEHGDSLALLVPGIRLAGSATDDQARVVTPADAARAGATWIVLGRTVTAAADPRTALKRVQQELL